jgi:putative transcriptional regulator
MSDFFESIKRGMEEAISHGKGEKTEVRLFVPEEVNVKQVREKTGLTQNQFASTFGISLGTLRHWERGDRKPHGPALVLLNAANNAPDELLHILTGRMIRPDRKKSARNRTSRTKMAA